MKLDIGGFSHIS